MPGPVILPCTSTEAPGRHTNQPRNNCQAFRQKPPGRKTTDWPSRRESADCPELPGKSRSGPKATIKKATRPGRLSPHRTNRPPVARCHNRSVPNNPGGPGGSKIPNPRQSSPGESTRRSAADGQNRKTEDVWTKPSNTLHRNAVAVLNYKTDSTAQPARTLAQPTSSSADFRIQP